MLGDTDAQHVFARHVGVEGEGGNPSYPSPMSFLPGHSAPTGGTVRRGTTADTSQRERGRVIRVFDIRMY